MIKKLLVGLILFVILLGAVGYLGYKLDARNERQKRFQEAANTKAPQTTVTLVEGWTNGDISDYLEKNNIVSAKDFLSAEAKFNISSYADLKDKPKSADLEGYIFPDTYFILANQSASSTATSIIKKALDNFEQKFTAEMRQQAIKNKMSIFEILTLASIIEKESGDSQQDRNIISGVFYNRLNSGQAMESDATVNYITKKKDPSLSQADTQLDTPYNTYKYRGLPPGPISNPSLGSLMAALYPEKTDYVYFLTDPKTGRAVFAKTYDQHLVNKQKYLK